MTGSVWCVGVSVAVFVISHVVLSSPFIRGPLVARLGERVFMVGYSVVSLLLFVWLVMAYNDSPYVEVWLPGTMMRHMALTIMPFSCILVVAGLATRNPTLAGVDSDAIARQGPTGILKVTRHPMMWGIILWGVAHLMANGAAADIFLFGGMTVLALLGALGIDAKKRASVGDAWLVYEAETSFVPFLAILKGRTSVTVAEIGWWRLALGLVLYGVILAVHEAVFGVSPFSV
ncbi:MAG: NnrU family protein [Rhodospirillales bacterium]|nr:NnrU family protein [Rhodospirillales bacterium]